MKDEEEGGVCRYTCRGERYAGEKVVFVGRPNLQTPLLTLGTTSVVSGETALAAGN